MVHLSAKSEYAIKALVRLALASGDEPVQARQIVAFTGIPPKFLDQVMHDLRHGGLVESRRGVGGGYVLTRDPAAISFLDVVDMIDGSYGGKGRMQGGGQAELLVAPVWDEVRECLRRILRSATIADAAARAAAEPMYYI
ncbi:MAG TPA: Rrf2 family transcriptional regulator [Thermoleophilia bacterium]|nr:Rrf2 family transcriptional regulator [Thermoleophilia bacterium]